jgi:glucose-6-phosphate 1-dehydrogenase
MPLENPFQDPLRFERRVPECAMVIFGANGDLTKRKLLPALYRLAYERRLDAGFAVLGISRTPLSDDQFREKMLASVKEFLEDSPFDDSVWAAFAQGLFYMAGDFDNAALFPALDARLKEIEAARQTGGNVLFYLSAQPSQYIPIAQGLAAANVGKGSGWRRIVVEKPFGHDLASAQTLSAELHKAFAESEVYRIDHYLGKETVQNLMVMRFANSIFEPIWNYKYIDHVQITVSETVSADDRAGYYDKSGATRDMIQNHIFQLMALVSMEPPAALDATSIRDEKVKVYKCVRPIRDNLVDAQTVRGQYAAGQFKDKSKLKPTPGYLKARGVAENSHTETFSAVKLFIDNWRWSGMPFYLRTGKCLPEKLSEIVVRFRSPPLTLFQKQCDQVYPNDLVIRVQPEEGISWRLNGKVPGGAMNIKSVALDFLYKTTFKSEAPEAYERLLYDCLLGDQTLFIRADEAEAAWQVIDPIEHAWAASPAAPQQYAPNTWGPKSAMDLIELDGRRWLHSGNDDEPIVACSI